MIGVLDRFSIWGGYIRSVEMVPVERKQLVEDVGRGPQEIVM